MVIKRSTRVSITTLVTIAVVASTAPPKMVVGGSLFVVGENGWAIPSNPDFYSLWASNKSFSIGDTLVFNFATGMHDVRRVTKEAYDACNSSNPLSIGSTSSYDYDINETNDLYFICGFIAHCSLGQKLAITNIISTKQAHDRIISPDPSPHAPNPSALAPKHHHHDPNPSPPSHDPRFHDLAAAPHHGPKPIPCPRDHSAPTPNTPRRGHVLSAPNNRRDKVEDRKQAPRSPSPSLSRDRVVLPPSSLPPIHNHGTSVTPMASPPNGASSPSGALSLILLIVSNIAICGLFFG